MTVSTAHVEDESLTKLREAYLKQLVERYEARSKTFRTLLYGFVGFGALFLLLVLLPFVGLHRQRDAVNVQIDAAARRAADLKGALDAYGKASAGFTELREAIDGGPDRLRASLRNLADPTSQSNVGQLNAAPIQQQAPNAPASIAQQRPVLSECDSRGDNDARMNCRVAEQVRSQFTDYASLLESSVIAPIEKLPAAVSTELNATRLRQGLDSIRMAFEARLAATPRFWEFYGGKVDFFGELRRDLDGYWTRFGFDEHKAALEASQRQLDSTWTALQTRKSSLENQEKGLVARLAQIESPLGKLPIGLVEGVQIFPLLMAIGFVWCCAVLIELAGMRRALDDGYRERGPEQAALTNRHLALVAPLWIERRDSSTLDAASRAVLFTPIAIFALSCGLVVYYWVRWSGAEGASRQDGWLYGSLYLIATGVLFIATRRLLVLLGQVRAQQPRGTL
jgi:hypothetical protein